MNTKWFAFSIPEDIKWLVTAAYIVVRRAVYSHYNRNNDSVLTHRCKNYFVYTTHYNMPLALIPEIKLHSFFFLNPPPSPLPHPTPTHQQF